MNQLEVIRMAQIALQDVLPLFKGRLNLGPRFEEPATRTKLAHTISKIEEASSVPDLKVALEMALEMLQDIWPTNYTWLTGEHHSESMHWAYQAILLAGGAK